MLLLAHRGTTLQEVVDEFSLRGFASDQKKGKLGLVVKPHWKSRRKARPAYLNKDVRQERLRAWLGSKGLQPVVASRACG